MKYTIKYVFSSYGSVFPIIPYVTVLTLCCSVVINVGEYRREAVGANKSHDFFHPNNEEAQKQRRYSLNLKCIYSFI